MVAGWTHSDWVQLGVAIGTSALALVTVYLAHATSTAAKEANHSRVDARAPRVTILADAQWPPMTPPASQGAAPEPMTPGVELPETNIDQPVEIMIRTLIRLRNEGTSTALLTATAGGCLYSDIRVDGMVSPKDRLQPCILVPAQEEVLVFDGTRTVAQWGASWTASHADSSHRVPLTLTIEVHDQFDDGIIDSTVVEVTAFPVDDSAEKKGYWRVRPIRDWTLVGDQGAPVHATTRPTHRRYRGE